MYIKKYIIFLLPRDTHTFVKHYMWILDVIFQNGVQDKGLDAAAAAQIVHFAGVWLWNDAAEESFCQYLASDWMMSESSSLAHISIAPCLCEP